jgi:hypothetical protein
MKLSPRSLLKILLSDLSFVLSVASKLDAVPEPERTLSFYNSAVDMTLYAPEHPGGVLHIKKYAIPTKLDTKYTKDFNHWPDGTVSLNSMIGPVEVS